MKGLVLIMEHAYIHVHTELRQGIDYFCVDIIKDGEKIYYEESIQTSKNYIGDINGDDGEFSKKYYNLIQNLKDNNVKIKKFIQNNDQTITYDIVDV
jgi:hypothetical protein